MPDVPRDPRQLARDILAGKVSIEELAREQQRRRAASAGGPKPIAQPPRPPQQQRPQPPSQIPAKIQIQRPAPPPRVAQPQRPVARPTAYPARPQPQPARTLQAVPSSAVARGPQPSPMMSPIPTPESRLAAPASRAKIIDAPIATRSLLANRAALRQGIIISEILGKPLALRDD